MGSSRKEEERNERIIRGLMKLPPNRRCMNCNSLGPQYVCINFWTFVCMTCSGIHREFTHRVKSVSMSKFTSQEVEALQNGGNQRAKEIYLKSWDLQRQRLPDSSNVDKIREFIKSVYVDRRYAGAKSSDKPPRDMQSHGSFEDETRRASSYHSYSQSPPYDYQYEDRKNRKHFRMLSRRPGSDRGSYIGKVSSFVYSPGCSSEQISEDRFANEGSSSRVSDYSVSSGGDPFRSDRESPNFQKDIGFNSPPQFPRDSPIEDIRHRAVPRPQRTASSGSFGSVDSNSMSLRSFNSASLVDAVSEPERIPGTYQDRMPTFEQTLIPESSDVPNLLKAPAVPELVNSTATSIDLFQLPGAPSTSPLDLFQPGPEAPHQEKTPTYQQTPITESSDGPNLFKALAVPEPVNSTATSIDFFQLPGASSTSSLDLFQPGPITPDSSLNQFPPVQASLNLFAESGPEVSFSSESQDLSDPKNEGWATFDSPPQVSASDEMTENHFETKPSNDGSSSVNFDTSLSFKSSMQWPPHPHSGVHELSSSVTDPWHDGSYNVQDPNAALRMQAWNAFDDSVGNPPFVDCKQTSVPQLPQHNSSLWNALGEPSGQPASDGGSKESREPIVVVHNPSTTVQQHLDTRVFEDLSKDAIHKVAIHGEMSGANSSSVLSQGEAHSNAAVCRSINPFDLPGESDLGQGNMKFSEHGIQQTAVNEGQYAFSIHSDNISESLYCPSMHPMAQTPLHAVQCRSSNPFDLPFESDLESNMFLDMSSLQTALPTVKLPSFIGGAPQPWFPSSPVAPCIPTTPEGGLAVVGTQTSGSQLP